MNNYDELAAYKEKRLKLVEMLNRSGRIISELNMNTFRESLEKLRTKVENDTFKVLVVGTFKNGKSTFINALLGEEVLPAYSLPCTAVINEVKYGDTKRAILHFRDPLPDKLPSGIPQKAMDHMRKFGMKKIPPMEIPYDEIEDYAAIPFGNDPLEMLLESPYQKIELYWPLELLKNGVEIIDSPGLNEHETRTRVTMEYLTQADAIIFVLTAQALCSQEEMRFIQNNLVTQGFTNPFLIVNRFDLVPEKEREQLKKFAHVKLDEFSQQDFFFFVSALNGLNGKLEQDQKKFADSKIGDVETRLSKYLTREKGRVKLTQPARELKRILDDEALYKVIPTQRKVLSESLDKVRARYEQIKPRIDNLKNQKEQLRTKLMLKAEQSRNVFRRAAVKNLSDISNSVPVWINEFKPSVNFGFVPTKAKAEIIFNEIVKHVSDKVEEHQLQWRGKVLDPAIQEEADKLLSSAEEDLKHIVDSLDKLNAEFAGTSEHVETTDVWERLAGVRYDHSSMMKESFKENFKQAMGAYFRTAAISAVGCGITMVLGILNPVTGILIAGTALFAQWVSAGEHALKRLKSSVTQIYVQKLAESAEDVGDKTAESITGAMKNLANQVVDTLNDKIAAAEEQMQGVLAELEKGQQNVNQRNATLDRCEAEIKEVSGQMVDYIVELAN